MFKYYSRSFEQRQYRAHRHNNPLACGVFGFHRQGYHTSGVAIRVRIVRIQTLPADWFAGLATGHLNGAEMDKHFTILTVGDNEPVTFGIREPFNSTGIHTTSFQRKHRQTRESSILSAFIFHHRLIATA